MKKTVRVIMCLLVVASVFLSCQAPKIYIPPVQDVNESERKDTTLKDGEISQDEDSNQNDALSKALDFSAVHSYEIKVGETVELASVIDGHDVYYEVTSGEECVSVSSNGVEGKFIGNSTVKAVSWSDSSKTWSCIFDVKVEGFNGSSFDYMITGMWKDGESYLLFNSDKTGELKVYKNGNVIQESSFNWSTNEASSYKFVTLSNGVNYINKQYTVESLSNTVLKLSGYLAFGEPQKTTWKKE